MGLLDDARREWTRRLEDAHEALSAPGGPAELGLRALGEVLKTADTPWRAKLPWLELSDPFWFDKYMVEVGDVSEGQQPLFSVVFDHSAADERGTPLLRLVGSCPKCERTVVLDAPFTDRAGLWHALRYGTPIHHRRCPAVVAVDVLPALRAHPADQRLVQGSPPGAGTAAGEQGSGRLKA